MEEQACDILIVGASTGGTAAAIAAARCGATVMLVERGDWPGGQLTSQGVCTPDENNWIENDGCTASYAEYRRRIRDHYQTGYNLSAKGAALPEFNPGSCWVSRLGCEPTVGVDALLTMLKPHVDEGNITIFWRATVSTVEMVGDAISTVTFNSDEHGVVTVRPVYVLDATDTGDLLPLVGKEGADWVVGAESQDDTGEPDAPERPRRDWVQPFTFPFALEWVPETAALNRIPMPRGYSEFLKYQDYRIVYGNMSGMFDGASAWWNYRRLLCAENFADVRVPRDLSMINTPGNDFCGGNILGDYAETHDAAEVLQKGRNASLGYLYWLQNDCERETPSSSGATHGYPELRLRRDLFGTLDGLSRAPYIRESRRILPMKRILEQQIVVRDFAGSVCIGDSPRAEFMRDSCGIGHYALDIHPNGHGEPNHYVATRPFQIPLSAMVPRRVTNLLPACKNAGVTHLTNGAYRLHPIEWAIGEAAALIAVWCITHHTNPQDVCGTPQGLQQMLVDQKLPICWYGDVPHRDACFAALQMLTIRGILPHETTDILFRPDDLVSMNPLQRASASPILASVEGETRRQAVLRLWSLIDADH